MPDTETGNRGRNRQKIPRIGPKEAALVFAQCEHLLDCSTVFVENLRQAGFPIPGPAARPNPGARGAAGLLGRADQGPPDL
jgi:hypothetical protein